MTTQLPQISPEVAELVTRINELETTLEEAKRCLLEWDRVNRALLYPHQHNTGAQTKKALKTIEDTL